MQYAVAAILAVFALSAHQVSADGNPIEAFKEAADCFKEVDFAKIIPHIITNQSLPHDLVCAISCALHAFKLVDENGHVNKEPLAPMILMIPSPFKEKVQAVLEKCDSETHDVDRCEAPSKYLMCLMKEGAAAIPGLAGAIPGLPGSH